MALLVPSAAAADCGECTIPADCVPSFSRCVTTTCTPDRCCTDVPVDCDDHLACTIDTCSEALGCQHADACDDGNPCNGAETCLQFGTGHLCLEGVPLDCDDRDACTVDQCRPSGCAHDTLDCDDHDPCTVDGCDHATGCTHAVIPGCCTTDAACRTDPCLQDATCTAGTCRGGVPVDLRRRRRLYGRRVRSRSGVRPHPDRLQRRRRVHARCVRPGDRVHPRGGERVLQRRRRLPGRSVHRGTELREPLLRRGKPGAL